MKRILVAAAALAAAAAARADTFTIDPAHSSVNFTVRHFVSKVHGRFTKFQGSFDYVEGKPKLWKAHAVIDAASVDTAVAPRDNHLRSGDFFDVKNCPNLEFTSTKVLESSAESAKLAGDLTMHCVTKPVVLDVEFDGFMKDARGTKAGVTATTKIDRKDFGMVWNKALDKGGMMLGDDVSISIDLEANAPAGGSRAGR